MADVPSPCIQVCRLDDQQVCVGCGRTIAEIAAWATLDEARRTAVVEAAARRRARPAGPPQAGPTERAP